MISAKHATIDIMSFVKIVFPNKDQFRAPRAIV